MGEKSPPGRKSDSLHFDARKDLGDDPITRHLRRLYDEVAAEPIPEDLKRLLDQIGGAGDRDSDA